MLRTSVNPEDAGRELESYAAAGVDELIVEVLEAVLDTLTSLDRLQTPDWFGPWLAGIGLNICRC